MRLPRARFTVGRIIVVVAVLAALMSFVERLTVRRWHKSYRNRAAQYAILAEEETARERAELEEAREAKERLEIIGRSAMRLLEKPPYYWGPPEALADAERIDADRYQLLYEQAKMVAQSGKSHSDQAARAKNRSEHFSRLRRKYEGAYARPWLSVDPDPPPP